MVNFKKFLAVALSATMVFGGSLTAFAAPVEVDGDGASEGHVDKKVVDVSLPTTSAETFGYTMDPERLIQDTDAAKYDGFTFPEADADTGVYFQTSATTYGNTSPKIQVINKGAVDQQLTVTAKLTDGATDPIAVIATAPTGSETVASLYMAAKVAGVTKALSSADATWVLKLPGNDANYKTVYDSENDEYVFEKITSGLTPWKAADIEVTGEVTEGITVKDTTTAPTLTLTWAFEDLADPEATYETGASYSDFNDGPAATPGSMSTSAKSAVISGIADDATLTSAKVVKADGSVITLTATTQYTYTNNTFAIVNGKEVLLDNTKYQKFVLTYSDSTELEIPIVAGE